MPITIKQNLMKYKNPSTGEYQSVDVIAESTTSEYVAELQSEASDQMDAIEAKGLATRESIPSDYTTLSDDVSDLKSALNYAEAGIDAALFPLERVPSEDYYAFTTSSGIYKATGLFMSSAKYFRTKFLSYDDANVLVFTLGLPEYRWTSWSYSNNSTASPGPQHSNTGEEYISCTQPLYVPKKSANDKYLIVCFSRVDGANMTTDGSDPDSDYYKIQHALKVYMEKQPDTTLTVSGVAADAKAVGDRMDEVSNVSTLDEVMKLKAISQGTLNTDTGAWGSANNRAYTNEFIFTGSNGLVEVIPKDGYKYIFREYSSGLTPMANYYTGRNCAWKSTAAKIAVDSEKAYRFVIAKTDDSDFSYSDIPSDAVVAVVKRSITDDMNADYNSGDVDGERHITTFVNGGYENTTGTLPRITGKCNTLRIPGGYFWVKAQDVVTVEHSADYEHALIIWRGTPENASLYSSTPAQYAAAGSATIKIDGFAAVVIRDARDNTAEINPTDFVGSISITRYSKRAVTEIEAALGKITTLTDLGPAVWFQGNIGNNGALSDSTNTCRSKSLVGYDSAAHIDIDITSGYKVRIMEYASSVLSTETFLQQLFGYTEGHISFVPVDGHMYRMTLRKTDNSDFESSDLPEDCVHVYIRSVKTEDNEDLKTAMDMINIISANGDNETITWEQGTLGIIDGAKGSASNRIRSKYHIASDSLRYLYFFCPEGYKMGIRKYVRDNEATFVQMFPFKTGLRIVENDGEYMYKTILKRADEEDITPSEVPEGVKVIPVYNQYWSKNAHGKSVAAIYTRLSNPTYVNQIVSVAQSYYDHRNDKTGDLYDMVYGYSTAIRQDSYTRQIDCSTFVGLILRGLSYEQTQYYTHEDTPADSVVANPDYVWSKNPQYYDYYSGDLTTDPNDATRASQLGEWMVDMGWRVPKDKKLLNLEVGDIIFYSRMDGWTATIAQPDRFMSINHVAIVVDKRETNANDPWTKEDFPYVHTMMEVTSVTPCVRTQIVQTGWDTPSSINTNNYNTLSLICRPDLGCI